MLGIKHLVNIECQRIVKCVSFVGGDSPRHEDPYQPIEGLELQARRPISALYIKGLLSRLLPRGVGIR